MMKKVPLKLEIQRIEEIRSGLEICIIGKRDAVHDVQVGSMCTTKLAQVARIQATRERDRKSKIQTRD